MFKLSSRAGVLASTSCLRPPILTEIYVKRPTIAPPTSSIVTVPLRSNIPWFSRQVSSSTSMEPSENTSQDSIINATTPTLKSDQNPLSNQKGIDKFAERRRTSGRRMIRQGLDLREVKLLREEVVVALLNVLGASVKISLDAGRNLEGTKDLTRKANPELNEDQVNLQAILVQLQHISFRHMVKISPEELVRIHWYLIDHRQRFYDVITPFASHLVDLNSTLPKIPQCRESVASIKLLLKYAHRYSFPNVLQWINKDARRHLSKGKNRLSQRSKEIQQIQVMTQTMLLSSSARRAFHFNLKRTGGLSRQSDRVKSLNSLHPAFRAHNNVFVISKVLRTRFGALKPRKRDSVQLSLKMPLRSRYKVSKHAAGLRQPPLHHNRSTRRLNRMIQRSMTYRSNDSLQGTSPSYSTIEGSFDKNPQQELLRKVGETFPTFHQTKEAKQTSLLFDQADKDGKIFNPEQDVYQIDKIVHAWRKMVRLWHLRRSTVTQSVMNVAAGSISNDENNLNSISSGTEIVPSSDIFSQSPSSAPLLPTWLLTAALQAQVEAGRPRSADHIVRLYLRMLFENRSIECEKLVYILPINSIIRAITNPLMPPNSPTMLNAILRAHLTNGMSDGWELMLIMMERWCYGGNNFVNNVRSACDMSPINRSNFKSPYDNHKDEGMACLHPNETSILIILESLRNRQERYKKGFVMVREAYARWGIEEIQPNSSISNLQEYKGLSPSFHLTTRTFRMLLQQSYTARSQEYVNKILSFFDRYIDQLKLKYSKNQFEFGINFIEESSLFDQLQSSLYDKNPQKSLKERHKWEKTIKKGIRYKLITPDRAQIILNKDR